MKWKERWGLRANWAQACHPTDLGNVLKLTELVSSSVKPAEQCLSHCIVVRIK